MALLDLLAVSTRDLLGAVMPDSAAMLWVPLLFFVLWLGGMLFVRRVVVPLSRFVRTLLAGAAVGVGALLLLPEFGSPRPTAGRAAASRARVRLRRRCRGGGGDDR